MSVSVLIADDDPIIRLNIRTVLEMKGYNIVGEARDGIEAVSLCEMHRPDLVLMDIKMPLFNGLRAAELIAERSLCNCILMLTAYNADEYVSQAVAQGVMGYLVKPVTGEMLMPAIEVALSRSNEIRKLKKQIDKAQQEVEDRKLIERCKGMLMKNEGLTEEGAYKRLQKLAMDRRCSKAVIAKMLILNEK